MLQLTPKQLAILRQIGEVPGGIEWPRRRPDSAIAEQLKELGLVERSRGTVYEDGRRKWGWRERITQVGRDLLTVIDARSCSC